MQLASQPAISVYPSPTLWANECKLNPLSNPCVCACYHHHLFLTFAVTSVLVPWWDGNLLGTGNAIHPEEFNYPKHSFHCSQRDFSFCGSCWMKLWLRGTALPTNIVCLSWRQHLQQYEALVLLLTGDRTADTVLQPLGRKNRVSNAMADGEDTAEQANSKQVTTMLLAAKGAKVGCELSLVRKSFWVLTMQCWSSYCAHRVDMGTKQPYLLLCSLFVLISTCRVASLYKQM